MIDYDYELVGNDYDDTSNVPVLVLEIVFPSMPRVRAAAGRSRVDCRSSSAPDNTNRDF